MVTAKPFKVLDDQLATLRGRGLVITSEQDSKKQLLKTSYYDLINGYKDMFLLSKDENEQEDKFIEGTKFEDLVELYKFDREIRHIVMRASLDVECNFYTTIAYCISERYGELQEGYLKKENYKRGTRQSNGSYERDNLIKKINKKVAEPYEHPMKHYKNKYGNIPPWILVKHLSFGELNVWYKLSPSDVKENIIRNFTKSEPDEKTKEMFIKSMELYNKFRNRAAHGGRMYNYRTNIEIPYHEEYHSLFRITKKEYNTGIGRSDFSALFISLIFLYRQDPMSIIEQLVILNFELEKYKENAPLYYDGVLAQLGLNVHYHSDIFKFLTV